MENERTAKALRLAEASGYEKAHTEQVRKLALKLFDGLKALHGLGEKEKELLEIAAILHDIAGVSGGKTHHKAARDIIIAAGDLPFDDETERTIVAMIVRYHKGPLPELSHKYYADLGSVSRRKVDMLAALLRVADGLDRSHFEVVKDLKCEVLSDKVILRIEAKQLSGIDAAAAQEKSDLFKKTFARDVDIRWT